MAAARPHEPLWREPTLEVERILMVDFTATQARAKGVTPSANHEGGGGRPRSLWPKLQVLYLHPTPTGWTGCTTN
jgi:hypothetical protein